MQNMPLLRHRMFWSTSSMLFGAGLIQNAANTNAANTNADEYKNQEQNEQLNVIETKQIPFYTINENDETRKEIESIYQKHKGDVLEFEFIDDEEKTIGKLVAMFDGQYLNTIGFKNIDNDDALYFVIDANDITQANKKSGRFIIRVSSITSISTLTAT